MPVIPDQVKQRPEYREAWTQYERQMDEWRKGLDNTLGQLTILKARLDALEQADTSVSTDMSTEIAQLWAQVNALLAGGGGAATTSAAPSDCCDTLSVAVAALQSSLASEADDREDADNALSNAISAISLNGNLDGGDADDVYGGIPPADGGGA